MAGPGRLRAFGAVVALWVPAIVLAAVATWSIGTLAVVFAKRLSYPMDLEWCEGGGLYMAYRVVHHLPLYVRPGDPFAPFPYPPAHTLALVLASRLWGTLDYLPGRMVSIVSFALLCASLVYAVVDQFEGWFDRIVASLATVGLVVCAYPASGGWFDLVRVDSMFLAFSVLAAALMSRPDPDRWRIVAAAVALTVAVYTKQTAAFFAVWICVFVTLRNWRDGVRLTALALLLCAVALGVLHVTTRGQFWFWIFENLTAHAVHAKEVWKGLRPILTFAPFAPALPVVFAGLLWFRRAGSRTMLWFGMLVASLPAALLPYAKSGGWLNDLIPVMILTAPVMVLMVADLLRTRQWWTPWARAALTIAAATFICLRPIAVAAYVPTPQMWRAAGSMNRLAASHPGGLLVPQLAFTPARNGQTNPHWHRMGHADLDWSAHPLDEDWAVVRAQAHWALINSLDHSPFSRSIRRRYRLAGTIPADERVHMLTGGGVVDLDELWERVSPADPPPPR